MDWDFDDFTSKEAPLSKIYLDLIENHSGSMLERVRELWELQMIQLRRQLRGFGINIVLPGNAMWNPHVDALQFITSHGSKNEDRKQTSFPEFKFMKGDGQTLKERVRKYRWYRQHFTIDLLDQAPYPKAYQPFSDHWESARKEKESRESRLFS